MSQKNSSAFHVLVKLVAENGYGEKLGAAVRANASRFAKEPGFISNELFEIPDGRTYASLIRWRSEADHLACMNAEHQRECPVGAMVQSGQVKIEIIPLSLVYATTSPTPLPQSA